MNEFLREQFPNSYKQRFLISSGVLILGLYLAALQVIEYLTAKYGDWIEDILECALWFSLILIGLFLLVFITELFRRFNVQLLNPFWNWFLKFMNRFLNALRNLFDSIVYLFIRGAVKKALSEIKLESTPIVKKSNTEEIKFDYLDVPHNHGWHDNVSLRRRVGATFNIENSTLVLRSPTEYHLDFHLNPIVNINPSTSVKFFGEIEDNARIYCQLKSNNDEQEYWLKLSPQINEFKKIGFSEWVIPVNLTNEAGYSVFTFNLKSEILKTFNSENLRPNKLTGFRLRGNIQLHKIQIITS